MLSIADDDDVTETMFVHWTPEACIADNMSAQKGLAKMLSSMTTVTIFSFRDRNILSLICLKENLKYFPEARGLSVYVSILLCVCVCVCMCACVRVCVCVYFTFIRTGRLLAS